MKITHFDNPTVFWRPPIANIRIYTIFLETKIIGLHFATDNLGLYFGFSCRPIFIQIFTARRYAERGYEIACRLSVCLSVRLQRLGSVIT